VADQSCPWVGLTHGFGFGLGRDFQFFCKLGWVESTIAKVLKNLKELR